MKIDPLAFLAQDEFFIGHRTIARHCDSVLAAIFLSELIQRRRYHITRDQLISHEKYGRGWFYYTVESGEERLCMSKDEQQTAIKILKKKNLITTEIFGMPPRRHFKINDHAVMAIYGSSLTPVPPDGSQKNSNNLSDQDKSDIQNNSTNWRDSRQLINEKNSTNWRDSRQSIGGIPANQSEAFPPIALYREEIEEEKKEDNNIFVREASPQMGAAAPPASGAPPKTLTPCDSSGMHPVFSVPLPKISKARKAEKLPPPRTDLVAFGELGHVMLAPEEYKKACDKHTKPIVDHCIEDLDIWIGRGKAKGERNHYLTLLTFIRNHKEEHGSSAPKQQAPETLAQKQLKRYNETTGGFKRNTDSDMDFSDYVSPLFSQGRVSPEPGGT